MDYEGETLRPVSLVDGLAADVGPSLNITGTMAGRAFQTQEVLSAETDDGWRVWAPARERAEQIGVLEPAYAVGGEAFDYALNGELLAFAILDAMGHGLGSTVASALALAGFRYGRRRGLSLHDMAALIDQALVAQFAGEVFVTGHLAQLDAATGELSWINAGHPDPLLIRAGRVVAELHAEPCFPLGLDIKVSEIGRTVLERGDTLLFYSDGVVEARPDGGEQFGLERLRDQVELHFSGHLLPAELLRRLVADVLGHRQDQLADDATLVLIVWPGARP